MEKKESATPMMQQYNAIKDAYSEHLLLYRLGDFYELFFDDAIKASKELNIILTKRGKKEGENIPMCGIPYHASHAYIQRLLNAGYSIAICEQMESPTEAKKRGHKSVVRREVTRIITPGTIIEDTFLGEESSSYLASVYFESKEDSENLQVFVSWADITTGEFYVTSIDMTSLLAEILRISPKEIIISDSCFAKFDIKQKFSELDSVITRRPNSVFRTVRAEDNLLKHYDIGSMAGISDFSPNEIIAAGALLEYIEHTQIANLPKMSHLKKVTVKDFMVLDSATRRHLEIMKNASGNSKNSLFDTINDTKTPLGARLLAKRIVSPFANVNAINEKLDDVSFFLSHNTLRREVRNILVELGDIERAMSRVSARRGSHKELNMIKTGIAVIYRIAETLKGHEMPRGLFASYKHLIMGNNLFNELSEALKDEDEINENDSSSVIRRGYSEHLDMFYDSLHESETKMHNLREKYRAQAGINNLKIGKNNISGYYVEVNQREAAKLDSSIFKHKQSLSNVIRFSTKELLELESNFAASYEEIEALEKEIVDSLFRKVDLSFDEVSLASFGIANIDVASSLAELAQLRGYQRPVIREDGYKFFVKNGRHPIVESALKEKFIANDCDFDESKNLMILTGPNMAGKSTYMRQNAMLCIMAQMGSFVSADQMEISVIDKLFTRIGASDNIAAGLSTFMVEMLETSYIMHNATSKSLIILDEVGRGTSTYDGLSIAWALVEHIHRMNVRTFFATHYHELANLSQSLKRCYCQTMKIQEWQGKIALLYKVVEGASNQSYGIHVAEIAGMPKDITERAKEKLHELQRVHHD